MNTKWGHTKWGHIFDVWYLSDIIDLLYEPRVVWSYPKTSYLTSFALLLACSPNSLLKAEGRIPPKYFPISSHVHLEYFFDKYIAASRLSLPLCPLTHNSSLWIPYAPRTASLISSIFGHGRAYIIPDISASFLTSFLLLSFSLMRSTNCIVPNIAPKANSLLFTIAAVVVIAYSKKGIEKY